MTLHNLTHNLLSIIRDTKLFLKMVIAKYLHQVSDQSPKTNHLYSYHTVHFDWQCPPYENINFGIKLDTLELFQTPYEAIHRNDFSATISIIKHLASLSKKQPTLIRTTFTMTLPDNSRKKCNKPILPAYRCLE